MEENFEKAGPSQEVKEKPQFSFKIPAAPAPAPKLKIPIIKTPDEEEPGAQSTIEATDERESSPVANSFLGQELGSPSGTLNLSKKVDLLKPGKSMVSWMRFQSTLDNTKPTLRKIGLNEIRNHSLEESTWMALRGNVYNVTDYVKYHPGGVSEIMKGAGKDATSLFDSVHRWVNYESILRNQHLGFVSHAQDSPDITHSLASSLMNMIGAVAPLGGRFKYLLPSTNFSQNDSSIFFEVLNRDSNANSSADDWTVGIFNRERLFIKLVLKPPEVWLAHYKLTEALKENFHTSISFKDYFKKMSLTVQKPRKEKWKAIGAPKADNGAIVDCRSTDDMHAAKILSKTEIAKDVFLFKVQVCRTSKLGVPIGFHLKFKIANANKELEREYTPVPQSLTKSYDEPEQDHGRIIHFILKIYSRGTFTQLLDNIPLEEYKSDFSIGSCAGTFDTRFFRDASQILLLSGGTGITPMIRIIQYLSDKKVDEAGTSDEKSCLLIFFNHREEDIIMKEAFESYARENSWFHFFPFITQEPQTPPSDGVQQGRVSASIIEDCFNVANCSLKDAAKSKKAIVCGSQGFNFSCERALLEHDCWEDIFIFGG